MSLTQNASFALYTAGGMETQEEFFKTEILMFRESQEFGLPRHKCQLNHFLLSPLSIKDVDFCLKSV